MEKKSDGVMIGDYLGTIEEFFPGEGTYAKGGKIFAAVIGEKNVDKEKHKVKVEGKTPLELKVGQIVYGDVFGVKKNSVIVNVKKVQGYSGETEIQTSLYVSNISDAYVKKPEDMFGIGDVVKAKIIRIDDNLVDIETKGEFGVVKAFCKRCRNPLIKSEKFKNRLICKNCGHKETRKIARDYGNVTEI